MFPSVLAYDLWRRLLSCRYTTTSKSIHNPTTSEVSLNHKTITRCYLHFLEMQSYVVKRQVLQLNKKPSKSYKSDTRNLRKEDKLLLKNCSQRKVHCKSEIGYSNGDSERVRHFSISKKGKIERQCDTVQIKYGKNQSLHDTLQFDEGDSLMLRNPYSVAVYGAQYTGKTSLIHQMSTSESLEEYDHYGEAQTIIPVVLDKRKTHIEFFECGSYLRYSSSFANNDAFLMVYSITDRRSFQCVVSMVRKLRNKYRSKKPIILVCNKFDLVRRRSICMEDGKVLAREYKCKYIETSVPLQWKVDDALVAVTKQLQLYNDFQPHDDAHDDYDVHKVSDKKHTAFVTFFKRIFSRKMISTESCENILKL